MKKAVIVYRSATGITRRYGEEIGAFLSTRGIETTVLSVGECDVSCLGDADYLLLGCWTNGWFVIHQHPDEPWNAFVRDLPEIHRPSVALFTTYKLLTGGMFAKMRSRLADRVPPPSLELKSRDGHLSAHDRRSLEAFVGA